MSNPAISIIIPVYNQEKYVAKCLESVLGQDFDNYEVLLINDGSKDRSLSICQEYAEKDCRISIVDKQNGGVALARKDGVLRATGEYLMFLDSDDYLPRHALTCLYQIAKEQNVDMVAGNCDRVYDSLGIIRSKPEHFKAPIDRRIGGKEYLHMVLGMDSSGRCNTWGIYVCAHLYRRGKVLAAIKAVGDALFPPHAVMEDMAFNLVIAPFLDAVWISDSVVYHYRYGGITSGPTPIIRSGGGYFDSRFDCCQQYGYESALENVFRHYWDCLCMDVILQLHYQTNPEEIKRFILNELDSRKIVIWKRSHMTGNDSGKAEQVVAGHDADLLLDLCREREEGLKKHYILKKGILVYKRIIDRLF